MNHSENQKLRIIEQLIMLNDDVLFEQIDELINKVLKRPYHKTMSEKELKARAEQSNLDISNNQILDQNEIEDISKDW